MHELLHIDLVLKKKELSVDKEKNKSVTSQINSPNYYILLLEQIVLGHFIYIRHMLCMNVHTIFFSRNEV